jgi:hypothetical protein
MVGALCDATALSTFSSSRLRLMLTLCNLTGHDKTAVRKL